MAQLCRLDEVDEIALTESEHVLRVLPQYFVRLPVASEDVIASSHLELLGGQVWHSVLVF